jgi:hypothetical protein
MSRNTILIQPNTLNNLGWIANKYPQPARTDTYYPINHAVLVKKVAEIFRGHNFHSGVMRFDASGDKMVAELRYSVQNITDMTYTVGIGNSYNKTIPVKVVAGLSVIACLNLQIHGDINYFRKHTRFLWDDIEPAIASIKDNFNADFESGYYDVQFFKSIPITDEYAWKYLGYLYGIKAITNGVFTTANKEWNKPSFPGMEQKNLWRLYNGCTYGMRKLSPLTALEMQRKLHDAFVATNITGNGNGDVSV